MFKPEENTSISKKSTLEFEKQYSYIVDSVLGAVKFDWKEIISNFFNFLLEKKRRINSFILMKMI